MDDKDLYTRKEFEKECGELQRSTLRYYEREGILKPAIIDKNGYRYYTSNQLYTYFHIAMLRKINCSVSEISEIFSAPDTNYYKIFADKKQEIDKMIQSLTQISRTLSIVNYLINSFPMKTMCKPRAVVGQKSLYYRLFPTDVLNKEHSSNQFLKRRKIDRKLTGIDCRYLFYPMGILINTENFLRGSYNFSDYIVAVSEEEDFSDCLSTGYGPTVAYSYISGTPLTQIKHLDIFRKYIIDSRITLKGNIHESTVPIRVNSNLEAEYLNIFSADAVDDAMFRYEYAKSFNCNK